MSPIKSSISSFKFLAIVLLVASCGFKPVYGTDDNNDNIRKLASITVEKIATRDGQIVQKVDARDGQALQNKLEDILNPSSIAVSPEYDLQVDLTSRRTELGIKGDLSVSRYDIHLNAKYKLLRLADNKIVDSGSVNIKSSFNRTTSEFATFVAEEDAGVKAAEEVAQEIRSRLIYYFSKE